MSESGAFKIGRTAQDPGKRLKQLQTGSSEILSLVCSFSTSNSLLLEKMLHRHYSAKKKTGEWFSLEDDEARSFLATCDNFEKTILSLKDNVYIKKKYSDEC